MSDQVIHRDKTHWANIKEFGNVLGIRFLFGLYKLFGRGIFLLALLPTTLYFLIVRPLARNASREYLDRVYTVHPSSFDSKPGLLSCFHHMLSFSQAALDKLIAWCETVGEEHFEIVDLDAHKVVMGDQRGQIIIGSHFGNLEFCRGFTGRSGKRIINALIHDSHAENFANTMAKINPESRLNLFQVTELDIATIAELRERLSRGEWVFIAGDRSPVNSQERTISADFLGRPAPFPIGPFVLASTLEHPVNFVFAYRCNNKIAIKFKRVAENLQLSRENRQQQLSTLIQDFADELSDHCKISPLQWFNFFPFWDQATTFQTSPEITSRVSKSS